MQANKYGYRGNTFGYMYWPSMLSLVGYLAAIATIDTKGTNKLHSVGAVYFFICLYFMVANFTVIAVKMRNWDARFMTRSSLLKKTLVAGYLTVVWGYCIIGLILENAANKDDIYVVIVEWNLVYAGLVWIFCFVEDWKHVYLALDCKTMKVGMREAPAQ